MPQGACKPLTAEEMEVVWEHFRRANEIGLPGEWLQWYSGGLKQGFTPQKAAEEASIEWDLL